MRVRLIIALPVHLCLPPTSRHLVISFGHMLVIFSNVKKWRLIYTLFIRSN